MASLQDACLCARVGCGAVSLRLEVIEELHDLPEAMEIKQWHRQTTGLARLLHRQKSEG